MRAMMRRVAAHAQAGHASRSDRGLQKRMTSPLAAYSRLP
jgi:hypothetical protein